MLHFRYTVTVFVPVFIFLSHGRKLEKKKWNSTDP